MAKSRLKYTRQQLTRTAPAGKYEWQCMICDRMGFAVESIDHEEDCPLADASCCGVAMLKLRPQIAFGYWDNRWYWRSPSGNEYRIEKLPACGGYPHGRYAMFDQAGNERAVRRTLTALKNKLAHTQGKF
jgi:hypothetical protein